MSAPQAVVDGPPTYSLNTNELLSASVDVNDDLPDYGTLLSIGAVRSPASTRSTTERPPKEYEYKIENKGKTIVTMTVMADPTVSKNMPTFLGLGPIKGNVCLSLDKPESIQSIVVTVIGRYLTGIEDEKMTFLELSRTLWSQGDPVQEFTLPDYNNANTRADGKLQGNYAWPFAVEIPASLTLPTLKSGVVVITPPQTFSERMLYGSVKYIISAKIKRGRLRSDHRIKVPIGYIPITKPPAFPLLRILAYQDATPLLGPDIDPDGWHALPPVQIKGKLFKSRPVHITCILSIGKPLSYTRGSVVPLHMRITSENQQAVDLLRAPQAIVVRLQRCITFRMPQSMLKNAENLHRTQGQDIRDMTDAVWWPSAQGSDDTPSNGKHVRDIHGELHLAKDLKPSSALPYFKIEYAVVLCPFSAIGLEAVGTEKVLQEQKVEIVTSFAPGPRAVRSAPPGYHTDPQHTREELAGFLSSTGFM